MAQIGAQIERNNDGSVNTLRTLESIARIFPKLRPDQQKSFADAMGLTPEMLTLMREGAKYAGLLAKADKVGLTVDPALNQQLKTLMLQLRKQAPHGTDSNQSLNVRCMPRSIIMALLIWLMALQICWQITLTIYL